VIAVSGSAATDNRGLSARHRPVVVPNAVRPAFVPAAARQDPRTADQLVVCAARLTPEKGVDVLLRAVARLRPAFPRLRLLVLGPVQAGHEDYRAQLDRLARDLSLNGIVSFAGFVEHPEDRWASAHVYVQPSREEGFGLAVAEAMASGLPVVATRVGGLEELVEHGRTGLLVVPDDPDALAAAVRRLLADPELAQRMGDMGRAHVTAQYTVERMVDGVEAVYRGLLAGASPA